MILTCKLVNRDFISLLKGCQMFASDTKFGRKQNDLLNLKTLFFKQSAIVLPEKHLWVLYLRVTEKDEHPCMGFS